MNVDILIFKFLNEFAASGDFPRYLSVFFAQWLIWFLGTAVFVYVIFLKVGRQKILDFTRVALSLILAFVLKLVISAAFFRLRPFAVISDTRLLIEKAISSPSFPSGHASAAFALAFSLFFVNRKLGALALLAAIFVGLGRILVGVHYPTDILGGAAVGFLSAAVVHMIAARQQRK